MILGQALSQLTPENTGTYSANWTTLAQCHSSLSYGSPAYRPSFYNGWFNSLYGNNPLVVYFTQMITTGST
jgi:hypothetical protein